MELPYKNGEYWDSFSAMEVLQLLVACYGATPMGMAH
jgi:hypothetical protein